MAEKIFYDAHSDKIKKAIDMGLIIRQVDSDGVIRYILTNKGFFYWLSTNKKWRF